MNPKTTNELLNILLSVKNRKELKEYAEKLSDETIAVTFVEYMNTKMLEKGKTTSEVICESQIQRNYGYQILAGKRVPGRDKIISLCLALKLTVKETQRALTIVGLGQLYSKNRRDAILLFCLQKGLSVLETNEVLEDMGECLL